MIEIFPRDFFNSYYFPQYYFPESESGTVISVVGMLMHIYVGDVIVEADTTIYITGMLCSMDVSNVNVYIIPISDHVSYSGGGGGGKSKETVRTYKFPKDEKEQEIEIKVSGFKLFSKISNVLIEIQQSDEEVLLAIVLSDEVSNPEKITENEQEILNIIQAIDEIMSLGTALTEQEKDEEILEIILKLVA